MKSAIHQKNLIPQSGDNKPSSAKKNDNEQKKNKKTAGNNQWVSTGRTPGKDLSEPREDGAKRTGQQPK